MCYFLVKFVSFKHSTKFNAYNCRRIRCFNRYTCVIIPICCMNNTCSTPTNRISCFYQFYCSAIHFALYFIISHKDFLRQILIYRPVLSPVSPLYYSVAKGAGIGQSPYPLFFCLQMLVVPTHWVFIDILSACFIIISITHNMFGRGTLKHFFYSKFLLAATRS